MVVRASPLDKDHYENNPLDRIKELERRVRALENSELSGVAGPPGATGPAGPTGSPGPGAPAPLIQGDVLVVDATPAITTLPIGSAHEILKVNAGGTDPGWEAFDWDEMSGVGGADMVHDHSAAAEGGATLNPTLVDLNGNADGLVLDADGDTSISAPTDDEIDIEVGGADIAEWKAGGLYGAVGMDLYADGDDYPLFDRLINQGISPDDHYRDGSEDLAWAGWAAYTGFVTPGNLGYPSSRVLYRHDAANYQRAFRYRAAPGSAFSLYARVAVSFGCEMGIMVDDGNDTGDGEGADNFIRFMLRSAAAAADSTLRSEYRTGGGAVSTSTAMTIPAYQFIVLRLLLGSGTPWTNWNAGAYYHGEHGEDGLFSWMSSFTWTPARVGIYWKAIASASTYPRGFVDWYAET